MCPDQFVVLNSKNKEIVKRSIKDKEKSAKKAVKILFDKN